MDDSRKWWKTRNSRGVVAHVPHTIVTPFSSVADSSEVFNNPVYGRGYDRGGRPYMTKVPIYTRIIYFIYGSLFEYFLLVRQRSNGNVKSIGFITRTKLLKLLKFLGPGRILRSFFAMLDI